MKKAALHNLGCKVNGYETEAMQKLLEEDGYEIVSFHEKADVYVINTCTVTNIADRKSRQMLHRARKLNPDAVIVAAGCYVQAQEEAGTKIEGIDILIGNNQKKNLIALLHDYEQHEDVKAVIDINHTGEFEELYVDSAGDHTRAYIKIQDGCNQFCTYCIIPYTRGRVRSRKIEDIEAEAKRLAVGGYKEIVLTGIHLDSYGVDLENENLLDVIRRIAAIDGIERIRLGSLEPRIMTEEFVEGLASVKELCPHFHLSMQSGCDETLKRMNRKYDTEEFLACCDRLRAYFDEPALTTDVIVGFPGETEEEFETTVEFIKKIRFYETHVFKYSRRKGTRADRMPDQIPEQIKTKRSEKLLELHRENSKNYRNRLIGTTVEVLMEEAQEIDGICWQVGHTREYVKVAVPQDESLTNQTVQVFVDGFRDPEMMQGKLRLNL